MSENRFSVQSLCKSYGSGHGKLEVLKGIDLSIGKNEFVAVQGPSGAGKSTLLHILGGLDSPSAGKVFFDNADIYALSENERARLRNRNIGFVFQFYHLLPELSALENVMLPALLNSWIQRQKAGQFGRVLLGTLGLSRRLNHKPQELSGGEQQRVAIARALINRPQVLLCDEPTGNLDSENGNLILSMLKKVHEQQGVTIILITHDKEIASSAQRTIRLKDGAVY